MARDIQGTSCPSRVPDRIVHSLLVILQASKFQWVRTQDRLLKRQMSLFCRGNQLPTVSHSRAPSASLISKLLIRVATTSYISIYAMCQPIHTRAPPPKVRSALLNCLMRAWYAASSSPSPRNRRSGRKSSLSGPQTF